MDWTDRMNMVIEYIESNLTNEIKFDEISKLSCCSTYNFQRIFSFIFNIPLSEYIRNRRLTAAAKELCECRNRVLDIAIKYQYESQEAFSRAFLKFHGATPASARKQGCTLSDCPKASLNQNHRRQYQMSQNSLLLQKNEPAQLFFHGVKGPGTLRAAISMWSYLEFIGMAQDAQQTYTILTNLTGEAYSPPVSLPLPLGIDKMLESMGFEHEIFAAKDMDKYAMRGKITEQLSNTRSPIIVMNELGDWCFGGAVIGYEDNGDTLISWGYFPFDDSANPQPILTPSRNWYTDNTMLAIIGKRKAPVDFSDIFRTGIKFAYDCLNTHYKEKNHEFYVDWKRILLQPINETIKEVKRTRKIPCTWGKMQEDVLTDTAVEKQLLEIIDPLWCDFAERRFYAARFLQSASIYFPNEKESLCKAQEAFDSIHSHMYEYIEKVDLVAGTESINQEKFTNPSVRSEMAELVEQCETDEQSALKYLREAIETL